jgi:hypothetical protein
MTWVKEAIAREEARTETLASEENFYDRRSRYRDAARKTAEQYSQSALSNAQEFATNAALAVPRSTASEFRDARKQVQQGRMYGDRVVPNLQRGEYAEAAKNMLTGAALNTAGNINTAMSPVTGLFNTLIPNLGVTERLMNTGVGQQALQLAQQNPRAAAVAGSLMDMGLTRTGGGALSQSLGAVADNTPTKIPGFYDSPNPLSKLRATASAAVPNIPSAIRQVFTPSGQEQRRVIGTGPARRREYAETGGSRETFGEQRGNMMASAFIETQRRGETSAPLDTVVGNTVEVQRYAQDWTDVNNIDRVKEGLTSYTDNVPDNVVDTFTNHLVKVHGASNDPGQTSLVIRRPETGEALQGEATGVAKATSPAAISSLASSRIVGSAKEALPNVDPLEFYTQFVSVAKHAHADKLRLAVRNGELPDEARSVLLNRYWRLKIREQKGQKINEKQQQVLDYFDASPKATLNDKGNGVYAFQENHASAVQDLGGVNDVIAVDTKNDMIYTMVSDGHDMFGMNPPGGNALLNATPIYSFKAGTKAPEKKGVARPEESVARIEEITGMPKKKGESNVQYQARVMRDYKGKANLQDYINVGKNVGRFGMLTGGMLGEDEEQQR